MEGSLDPRRIWSLKRRAARARVTIPALATRGLAPRAPLTVANLSAGGALLVGGSGWCVGEEFGLEIQLEQGFTVAVQAVVVRLEPRRGAIGVAVQFKALTSDAENAIQRIVTAALDDMRAKGVRAAVGVTTRMEDIRALAPTVSNLGMEPLFVTTFLHALRWLQDPEVCVTAFIADMHADGDLGQDMLAWCADEFPALQRMLICRSDEAEQLAAGAGNAGSILLVRPIDTDAFAATIRASTNGPGTPRRR